MFWGCFMFCSKSWVQGLKRGFLLSESGLWQICAQSWGSGFKEWISSSEVGFWKIFGIAIVLSLCSYITNSFYLIKLHCFCSCSSLTDPNKYQVNCLSWGIHRSGRAELAQFSHSCKNFGLHHLNSVACLNTWNVQSQVCCNECALTFFARKFIRCLCSVVVHAWGREVLENKGLNSSAKN